MHLESKQFMALYRAHRSMVFSVAKGVVGDEGIAEDVTQEVFVRLDRSDNVEFPYAWLRRVTRRLALNWERDRRRRVELMNERDGAPWQPEEIDVLGLLVSRELTDALRSEVATWPEEFQEIALRLMRGDKPHEIQRDLNLPSGTVSSRIHRIRKRFELFFDFQKQVEDHTVL